jgi:SAM-dependent methyltransferase
MFDCDGWVTMAIDVETTSTEKASAGDYDYDRLGHGYSSRRQADPRVAAFIHAALGPARTVLNVGAGAGSYEPEDRYVLAVEPSATMRAQRPRHLTPAIRGFAEALPLDDNAFDASMATLTVHQWADRSAGLREMRRVTRGAVVILTFDPDAFDRFWLFEYAPELAEIERRRFPSIATICGALGEPTEVHSVPIPLDCTDGFAEAFYGRPERFLDLAVRKAQSGWGFLQAGSEERIVRALARDLDTGAWDRRHGALRRQPQFEGAVRLVVSRPA